MRSISGAIWRIVDGTAMLAFCIMLVLVTAQILFRYALRISVPWTEEAARWFYAWQIFLGSAVAMRAQVHLRVTVVVDRFHGKPRVFLDFLTALSGTVFLAGIIWGSLVMMYAVYPVEAGSFPISTSYLYLSIPVGLIAMLALSARDVVDTARRLLRPRRG